MAQVFSIQVLGLGNDFVLSRPAFIIMWDESIGAVELFYPLFPGQYTVYKFGSKAMLDASIVSGSYVNRIVSSSDQVLPPTNEASRTSPRASNINFAVRQPGSGGASSIFYNFNLNQFQSALFTQTYGATVYNRATASFARDQASTAPGTYYDIFQSNY